MYARITKVKLANGRTRADAEAIADHTYPIYKTLKGFVSATYLAHDESKNEYGSITVWKTKEDAEAANAHIGPIIMGQHADKLASPPDAHTAEVYEPK